MKRLTKILCVGLGIVMVISLAACSRGKEEGEAHVDIDSYTVGYTDHCMFENGATAYKIILPAQATESEKYAAQELSSIFEQSTGKALPVAAEGSGAAAPFISIGDTDAAKSAGIDPKAQPLGNGGFVIRTVGENL